MSRPLQRSTEASTGFPRVSGDEPWGGGDAHHTFQFSPRERG